MAKIPPEVETAVVTHLYSDAHKLDWSSLRPQQRSSQYDKWVEDPEVGGKLKAYLTPSSARVWIKDGPMKEWTRAQSGIGKYAKLMDDPAATQRKVVQKGLGSGWEALSETLKVKPLRITARNPEGEEAVVTWAPSSGLKHMAWAALSASAEGDRREWVICVTDTFTKPTPANEAQAHARLAKRCGLRLVHVTV
jgi:hypothetical protein